jgi:DNA-binding IscR family transcriptional regulator
LLQRLVHVGLISAKPGVGGGCVLRIPADEISILRIVESIDGTSEIDRMPHKR